MFRPLFITSILFLFFTSCGSSETIQSDTESDNSTDADQVSYDENAENEDDFIIDDEKDDIDTDFSSAHIVFKTQPDGITRWGETYSYFVRCESSNGIKPSVSVSQYDNCNGKVEDDRYTFTPTKEKFPLGKCTLAVKCSYLGSETVQKTEILIPNPAQLIDPEIIKERDIYFINTKDGNDQFAASSQLNSVIYRTNGNSENTVPVLEFDHSYNRTIMYFDKMALITNGVLLETYDSVNGQIEQIDQHDGGGVTEQVGPGGRTQTIYLDGIYNLKTSVGNLFLFGAYGYNYNYSLYTTDGTADGTVSQDTSVDLRALFPPSIKEIKSIRPDTSGGFYFMDMDFHYYVDKTGKNQVDLNVHDYSYLGFNGEFFYYYDGENNKRKIISIKEGKPHSEYQLSETGLPELFISGNSVTMLEEKDQQTDLLHFPDGEISEEPLRIQIFNDPFEDAKILWAQNDVLICSAATTQSGTLAFKKVMLNKDETSENTYPFYFSKHQETTNFFTIIKDLMIFSEEGELYSVPTDGTKITETLVESSIPERNYYFYGTTHSNEAILFYYDPGTPQRFVSTTGGKSENTKTIFRSDSTFKLDIWNGWMVELGQNIIIEDKGELKIKVICGNECTFTDYYMSDSSIYYLDRSDSKYQKIFSYQLPKVKYHWNFIKETTQ